MRFVCTWLHGLPVVSDHGLIDFPVSIRVVFEFNQSDVLFLSWVTTLIFDRWYFVYTLWHADQTISPHSLIKYSTINTCDYCRLIVCLVNALNSFNRSRLWINWTTLLFDLFVGFNWTLLLRKLRTLVIMKKEHLQNENGNRGCWKGKFVLIELFFNNKKQ